MEKLVDIATFTSDSFGPYLPDDCQVNPGVYGFELAHWLSTQLASRGVVTSYPESEDWGWYLTYQSRNDAEFAVHCLNTDDEGTRWSLQLRPFARKLFGRDVPPLSEAATLITVIRAVLTAEASLTEFDWRFPDAGVSGT